MRILNKFIEVLANLLLGLLAILVPIFAVLVSASARAIEEGRRRLEQNIKGIFADIDEIENNRKLTAFIRKAGACSLLRKKNSGSLFRSPALIGTNRGTNERSSCLPLPIESAIYKGKWRARRESNPNVICSPLVHRITFFA